MFPRNFTVEKEAAKLLRSSTWKLALTTFKQAQQRQYFINVGETGALMAHRYIRAKYIHRSVAH